jgi:hypothetical protein
MVEPCLRRLGCGIEAQMIGELNEFTEWLVEMLHGGFFVPHARQPRPMAAGGQISTSWRLASHW